jgi:hypothetical protein
MPAKATHIAAVPIRIMTPPEPDYALVFRSNIRICSQLASLRNWMHGSGTRAKECAMWTSAKAPSLAEMETMRTPFSSACLVAFATCARA